MGLGQAFVELFSSLSVVAAFLIVVGLMLVIVEMFRYSRRIFGIIGSSLIATGVFFRSMAGFDLAVLLLILMAVAVVLLVVHQIKLKTQKTEWLYQSINSAVNRVDADIETYEFSVKDTNALTDDIERVEEVSID